MQAKLAESSDPKQVLTRLRMVCKQLSMQLQDGQGSVATTSATALCTTVQTYKTMMAVSCSVGSAALVTPTSNVIQTGALVHHEANFLHVDYVSSPHDTDFDHAVKVWMAPAYVTYDAALLERAKSFVDVQAGQELDLSALGAQAAARLQEVQVRSAATQCTSC